MRRGETRGGEILLSYVNNRDGVMRWQLSPAKRPGQGGFEIECDPARFHGTRSAVGSTLWVPITIMQTFDATLLALGGSLAFAGDPDGISIPLQPLIDAHLRVPLTDEQIFLLERKRAGQPLILEIILRGIGSSGAVGAELTAFAALHNPPVTIQRDEWLRVYDLLGFGKRRLIELPPSPRDEGGLWNVAATSIDAAARRLAIADYGGAMTEARTATEKTLEAVAGAMEVPRKKGEAFRNFFERILSEVRSRHEKRGDDPFGALAGTLTLCSHLFGFASGGPHHHLERTEAMDAELALSLISAMYTYFARLRAFPKRFEALQADDVTQRP